MSTKRTTVLAGIAANNASLFHRVQFSVGDAMVMIDFADKPLSVGTSFLEAWSLIAVDRRVRLSRSVCAGILERIRQIKLKLDEQTVGAWRKLSIAVIGC